MHSLAGCRVVAGGYQQSLAVIISSLHSRHKHVCKYSQTPAKQKQTVLAFKVKAAHFNDCSGKTQLLLWSLMFSVSSSQTFSSSSVARRVNAGVCRHVAMFHENYVWLRQSASEQQSNQTEAFDATLSLWPTLPISHSHTNLLPTSLWACVPEAQGKERQRDAVPR